MQYKMWDGQGRVVNSHPYMSTWTDWATIKRPIWYAFDKEGAKNEFVRGVILLGNPWILWTGLIAVATCAWSWIQERKRDAFIIFTTFAAFYFSWAIIPRKVAFFYYYYPAGMVLSLALGFVFFHGERAFTLKLNWPRWAFFAVALVVFIYFFPVSAALQIPADTFRKWMWRSSWI
jgi:dolichyl-phosphate-mannose--protein O-mannosyl transferase